MREGQITGGLSGPRIDSPSQSVRDRLRLIGDQAKGLDGVLLDILVVLRGAEPLTHPSSPVSEDRVIGQLSSLEDKLVEMGRKVHEIRDLIGPVEL